ncbi:hypothetical protein FOA52_010593 [Chlamydomonas sp. UWO 241]|nr:hypothetical protein FOA52_010593 [Chlamydomonas sp. UWO 241]
MGLFNDVVVFWRSQLQSSVVALQQAIVRSPDLSEEHPIYLGLSAVEDCLKRIYSGSDAFYSAVVSGREAPLPAICQIVAQMLANASHLPTFSQLVWRSAVIGKLLQLVRLVGGVPAWAPTLQERHRCSDSVSMSVLEGLQQLSSAAQSFLDACETQPAMIQSYLATEQCDGEPEALLSTFQGVARELVEASAEVQEMIMVAVSLWEPSSQASGAVGPAASAPPTLSHNAPGTPSRSKAGGIQITAKTGWHPPPGRHGRESTRGGRRQGWHGPGGCFSDGNGIGAAALPRQTLQYSKAAAP